MITYIRRHTLRTCRQALLSLLLCPAPPTRTRHWHWLTSPFSFKLPPREHTKWPNLFFAPKVRWIVSSPMTYSYTSFLISIGTLAKIILCACICVRTSELSSRMLVNNNADLRRWGVPRVCSVEGLKESSIRRFDLSLSLLFSFVSTVLESGCVMSCGVQRMLLGRNVRSIDCISLNRNNRNWT
jgi:hypothetical protein